VIVVVSSGGPGGLWWRLVGFAGFRAAVWVAVTWRVRWAR
jgi:hypothetical protein